MKKFLDFLNLNRTEVLVLIFVLALILRILISWPFYSGDVTNHLRWGNSILEEGIIGFYSRDFSPHAFQTYPPIGMLPFAFSVLLYSIFLKIVWIVNVLVPPFPSRLVFFFESGNILFAFLKLSAILGDLGIAYFLFRFSKKVLKDRFFDFIIPSLYLFNPAVFYLSANWGQIESLAIFFALGAFFYLFEKRARPAIMFLAFSLLSKQTAAVFIPIFAILFLKFFGLKRSFLAFGTVILIFWLAYMPFGFFNPIETILFYLKTFSFVSDRIQENAFNLWVFIFGFNKHFDYEIFWGFPLKFWGYVMFMAFSMPALLLTFKNPSIKTFSLALPLLTLGAFLFLTRMHERYLALSLPFILLAFIYFRQMIVVYIAVSLTHFINLYNGFFQPSIQILNTLLPNLPFVRFLIFLNFVSFFIVLQNIVKNFKPPARKNVKS